MIGAAILAMAAWAQDRGARGDDAGFDGETEAYVPAPRDRLYYTNATFLRVNPLGLVDIVRVGWRRRLSTKDSLLLRDTYAFVGPSAILTPAYARLGGYGEAQLLAVLRVFAGVEGIAYFGTFDQALSFDDPTARYSDQTIATLGDAGAHAPRLGWVTNWGFTLRAAAGPIAIRTTPQVTRFDLDLPEGDVALLRPVLGPARPQPGLHGPRRHRHVAAPRQGQGRAAPHLLRSPRRHRRRRRNRPPPPRPPLRHAATRRPPRANAPTNPPCSSSRSGGCSTPTAPATSSPRPCPSSPRASPSTAICGPRSRPPSPRPSPRRPPRRSPAPSTALHEQPPRGPRPEIARAISRDGVGGAAGKMAAGKMAAGKMAAGEVGRLRKRGIGLRQRFGRPWGGGKDHTGPKEDK